MTDAPGAPTPSPRPHVAVLGAGPVGLEAALAAVDAGLSFTVYEAAAEPEPRLPQIPRAAMTAICGFPRRAKFSNGEGKSCR